jgi:hypothetical protein
MNVTIHSGGDYLQLLLLLSHELQLYNLTDSGKFLTQIASIMKKPKNKVEQKVFPKEIFCAYSNVDQIESLIELSIYYYYYYYYYYPSLITCFSFLVVLLNQQ